MLLKEAGSLPASDLSFRFFRVDTSSARETRAVSLSTDDFGNTYVVGNTYGTFGKADSQHLSQTSIFAAKFSKSGYLVWATRTGSAHSDEAYDAYYFRRRLYIGGATKGNISTEASSRLKSLGIQDGFVIAYDSFTGRRQWGRQFGEARSVTQVNAIKASHSTGVLISGHTNGFVFNRKRKIFGAQGSQLFLARLNPVVGTLQYATQLVLKPPFSSSVVPIQLSITRNSPREDIYIVLQSEQTSGRKESSIVSLSRNTFELKRVISVSEKNLNKIFSGLTDHQESNSLLISYSVFKQDPDSRDFGLQKVLLDQKAQLHLPENDMTMKDFASGSDDECKGIVVTEAGFAFLLGSISPGGGGSNRIGVWVYNLQNKSTIGTYLSRKINPQGRPIQVAGFRLDESGNIVFAGFQRTANGGKELSLGTFGIPPRLKIRNLKENPKPANQAPSPLHAMPGNGSSDETGSIITSAQRKGLTLKNVLIICLISISALACAAIAILCIARYRHRKPAR